jgi:nucleoside-diphosphate-sugar epimerase
MNKEINHFVILGGAGYLGVYLVKEIASQANSKVTIVTRNKSKQILFRGYENVFFKSSTKDILNQNIFVVNLAYGLDVSYKITKKLNDLIIGSIDVLCSNNQVKSLIHVSSIVLSEENMDLVPKLDKTDTYKYAKSIAELGVKKIYTKYNIPTLVVRSGNILGPGSIWAIKICKYLIDQKPIATKSNDFFSNATYVGNLTDFLSKKPKKLFADFEIINFNEFGSLAWNEFIEIVAEEIGIQPKVWNSSNIRDFKVSFSRDLKNAINQMVKIAILKIYKGPISNKFIDKLLDTFNITKLDQKAKSNIKAIDNDHYPDAQEFALLKVFMNSNNIENCLSEKEVNDLPYDFSKVSDELVKWLRIAGYSSLKL